MRFFLTNNGLVPITMSDEALFDALCDHTTANKTNKYASSAVHLLGVLLDDDSTVFRHPDLSPEELCDVIISFGRMSIQARLELRKDDIERSGGSSKALIIREIRYQFGNVGYSAEVSVLSKDWLNILVRKAIIDELLNTL